MMMSVVHILRFKAGVNLPLIRDHVTVADVLREAAAQPRRAGAVVLVDEAGRLSGIFTDGDLRRHLMTLGPSLLTTPVADLMTRSPRALSDSAMVRDAVQMVRELRVDELPVVDEAGKPVGLIDVQDLIALKVVQE
jgi:arabinose-5-phosphate isomerase